MSWSRVAFGIGVFGVVLAELATLTGAAPPERILIANVTSANFFLIALWLK